MWYCLSNIVLGTKKLTVLEIKKLTLSELFLCLLSLNQLFLDQSFYSTYLNVTYIDKA
ncbi:hypothetical protein HMPREF9373_1340 [Psychrobacter sp. 1501(2011)]|nr:hypothetical protein HMPREF9373_1340 [Psychrobacter sp. 1501(2011)]